VKQILAASVVAGALVLMGAMAPVAASATGGSCEAPAVVALDNLGAVGGDCSYPDSKVQLDDGRLFPIPDPDHSVTLSAITVEGFPEQPEVTVARAVNGDLAVEVGDEVAGTSTATMYLQRVSGHVRTAQPSMAVAAASTKCSNTNYKTFGFNWNGSYGWKYNSSGQASGAWDGIFKEAALKWNGIVSTCGTTRSNNSTSVYQGTTTGTPKVNANVTCGSNDGQSTVGWGKMSTANGTLAATCTWRFAALPFDSDQKYNTAYPWNTGSACSGSKYDLRGVAAHEFGHSYGLDHATQASQQTMKPASPYCDTEQRGLGLGDATGIKSLYG
jgi:hypothetical protein